MNNVILANHKQIQCGVYQYGKRVFNILQKSRFYNFIYIECESESEFISKAMVHNPIATIYNYHPLTMAWLHKDVLSQFKSSTNYCLHHEGSEHNHINFDHYLYVDSTYTDTQNRFAVPRPLFEDIQLDEKTENQIPVVTSFGFGFGNKGFGRVVKIVNDSFDEAIIKLQIPRAYYGDRNGEASSQVFPGCYNEIKKPGIKLEINTEFLTDQQILNLLNNSTLNIFLYDDMPGRGLSSTIDYALSVNTPLAINRTYMFRHIFNTEPSICVEDISIIDIINFGDSPIKQYKEKWSNKNLVKRYEDIITKTRKR